ncbi:MAG: hypothetical protein DRN81_00380 [Thermoproteota archaeon]|nr:MAG: hypothetical protein DRN81_00380 [Candidatus Korarchaeota archaeon]
MSHKAFLEKLREAGIEFRIIRTREIVDEYYDTADMKLYRNDRALRIRKIDGKLLLTFKGRRLKRKPKYRLEKEAEMSDKSGIAEILNLVGIEIPSRELTVRELRDILRQNGFTQILKISKKRSTVQIPVFKDLKIYLDSVELLGEYVEVEGKHSLQLVANLNISDKIEHRTYPEIMMETVKT